MGAHMHLVQGDTSEGEQGTRNTVCGSGYRAAMWFTFMVGIVISLAIGTEAGVDCGGGHSDAYTGNIHHAKDIRNYHNGNPIKCQKWNSQYPHKHNIVKSDMRNPADYDTNKCRSPHEGWVWFVELGRHSKPWFYD